ncbi:ATP-binding cassette domain-containing protein [Streptomyces sp. NPDC051172]|uniref:ABC transporter ATP-binding protein n=1 Tax=Streptomyces sp. NPDC051172 TaxID=3155796 RepID=UPI0034361C8C
MIEVHDLVKEYRRPERYSGRLGGLRTLLTRKHAVTRAVDGVSFSVGQGEMIGYLGPNGAGKSTTIKMLAGILKPTSGIVRVAGLVPWQEREHNARNIGVAVGQRTQLWWDLPLRDSLTLIGRLYGMERSIYAANIAQFTELLGLGPFLGTPVRHLSLGQLMRGDLAAALLPEPRVLYLDEPTVGLDVVAKERIRDFVASLNKETGVTVVLTTHDLEDVERLCDRIVLIDKGRVLYDGKIDTLKAQYAPYRNVIVQLADGQPWNGAGIPHAETSAVEPESGQVRLSFDPARVQVSDVVGAVLRRHHVTDLSIVEPHLEGIIHRIYSGKA